MNTLLAGMVNDEVRDFKTACTSSFDVFVTGITYAGTIYKSGANTTYSHVELRAIGRVNVIQGYRTSEGWAYDELTIKGYCTNLQTKTINVYKDQPIIINVFRNVGGKNNYVKFVYSANEMVEVERIGFSINDIVPTYQNNILTLKNNVNGYVYYKIE